MAKPKPVPQVKPKPIRPIAQGSGGPIKTHKPLPIPKGGGTRPRPTNIKPVAQAKMSGYAAQRAPMKAPPKPPVKQGTNSGRAGVRGAR